MLPMSGYGCFNHEVARVNELLPPRLPSKEADLSEWSVYADYLIERGEPRGELVAREIATSELPTVEELAAIRALATTLCPRERPSTWTLWTLGHADRLMIPYGMSARALVDAAPALRAAETTTTTTLAVVYRASVPTAMWRTLFARMPRGCARVEVSPMDESTNAAQLERFVACLPNTVRELALSHFAPGALAVLATDRFDLVELTGWIDDPRAREEATAALAQTSRMRLRTWTEPQRSPPHPRLELGRPGDGIVELTQRRVALPRWTVADLDAIYGYLPIRTRLAGVYPELHGFPRGKGRILRERKLAEGVIARTPAGWQLGRADGSAIALEPGATGAMFDEPFTFRTR